MSSGRLSSTILSGLVEILDGKGQPLCLIPPRQAQEQQLSFRTVAVQLSSPKGTYLLSETANHLYEITCIAPLPAGKSLFEFACELQTGCIGHQVKPRLLARLAPDQIFVFHARHSEALLNVFAPATFLSSTRAEIAQLAGYGLIGPLLSRALPLLP